MAGPMTGEKDLFTATEHLIASAARLGSGHPVGPDNSAAVQFAEDYREWIIFHHGPEGTSSERSEQQRLLLYVMMAASTLSEAIGLLIRSVNLIWRDRGASELVMSESGGLLKIRMPFRPGAPGLLSEIWALSLHIAQFEMLIGGTLDGVTGHVRQSECIPAATKAILFDQSVSYDEAETALFIPAQHLRRPVIARADQVPDFIESLFRKAVGIGRSYPDVTRLVAALLRADLHQKNLDRSSDISNIAIRLGYSQTTLRRRLTAEGTSFRQVKVNVMDELAISWLKEGASLERIAERLGYSDTFAFRRAFRRQHNCSPSAFRRQQNAF